MGSVRQAVRESSTASETLDFFLLLGGDLGGVGVHGHFNGSGLSRFHCALVEDVVLIEFQVWCVGVVTYGKGGGSCLYMGGVKRRRSLHPLHLLLYQHPQPAWTSLSLGLE